MVGSLDHETIQILLNLEPNKTNNRPNEEDM